MHFSSLLHLCSRKDGQRERTFSLAKNSYPAPFVLQSVKGGLAISPIPPMQAKEKCRGFGRRRRKRQKPSGERAEDICPTPLVSPETSSIPPFFAMLVPAASDGPYKLPSLSQSKCRICAHERETRNSSEETFFLSLLRRHNVTWREREK